MKEQISHWWCKYHFQKQQFIARELCDFAASTDPGPLKTVTHCDTHRDVSMKNKWPASPSHARGKADTPMSSWSPMSHWRGLLPHPDNSPDLGSEHQTFICLWCWEGDFGMNKLKAVSTVGHYYCKWIEHCFTKRKVQVWYIPKYLYNNPRNWREIHW